jgi:hypothetical protein
VILIGEIVPILLVAAIVLVARRYSVTDQSKGRPPSGSPDVEVAEQPRERRDRAVSDVAPDQPEDSNGSC